VTEGSLGGPKRGGKLSIAMIGTRGMPASDGGVETAVEALSCELIKRGHQVTVYGRRGYCDPSLHWHNGVRQVPLPHVNTKHLEAISHTALATAHAVAGGNHDLVHFHATGPSLLSWLPRLRQIPTVATIQGMDWKREKWGVLASSVLRVAARTAATVPNETIVVSRVLHDLLWDNYHSESHFIPNGVDLSSMRTVRPIDGLGDRPFVLFLGRIVPEKQVHVLIQAFMKLRGDFQLAVAGSSSHSDQYYRDITQLAAGDDRIVMLGSRYGSEKGWLLQNAAVFVQPSTIEGLPIALLEALASDRLTIVSDIPENVEAVTLRDGEPSGLTFRTGDVEDLSRKLLSVLSEDSLLPRETPCIGELVRQRYDWEHIAEQTECVYRQALSG
jgi:glycosyltransferase involved in cell wall biosynthesis